MLGQDDYGYRGNRSVTDLIFGFKMVVERSWEYNQSLYIAFIDLQKAFDSIPREKCMEERYGVTEKLKEAIKSLYDPCLCSARLSTGTER